MPEHKVILMRDGLSMICRRCALAHELAHRELGHRHHVGRGSNARNADQEIEARQWAARRLITVAELAAATAATCSPREMALYLFVTPVVLSDRLAHLHPAERAYLRRATAPKESS